MPRTGDKAVSRSVQIGRCEWGREVTQELIRRNGRLRVAYRCEGVEVTWPAPGPSAAEVDAFFAAHAPTAAAIAEEEAVMARARELSAGREPGVEEIYQAKSERRAAKPVRERLAPQSLVPDDVAGGRG